MRDIKRIKKFCDKLEEVWNLFPDLRFWQLIGVFEYPEGMVDPFYVEEDEWMEILNRTIDKYKGSSEEVDN